MPRGEVLDLQVNVTTDPDGLNNGIALFLYQDGEEVAISWDDGNNDDDNVSVSLLFKEKVTQYSHFQVKAWASSWNRQIPPTHLQIGYKTYGSGHDLFTIV